MRNTAFSKRPWPSLTVSPRFGDLFYKVVPWWLSPNTWQGTQRDSWAYWTSTRLGTYCDTIILAFARYWTMLVTRQFSIVQWHWIFSLNFPPLMLNEICVFVLFHNWTLFDCFSSCARINVSSWFQIQRLVLVPSLLHSMLMYLSLRVSSTSMALVTPIAICK